MCVSVANVGNVSSVEDISTDVRVNDLAQIVIKSAIVIGFIRLYRSCFVTQSVIDPFFGYNNRD
jgi:hypothetical protein